jgi:hypothetical protein
MATGCHEHNASHGVCPTDAFNKAEAIFTGQIDVDQVQIGDAASGRVINFFSAHDASDLMALLAQKIYCGFAQAIVVFHQKDVKRWVDDHAKWNGR